MPKLLESTVARITVPQGKRDILVFDDTLPGFGIRKFASGKASFIVKYQVGSQQRKLTLGAVVPGVVAEMRRKASDILARARIGQDVAAEKQAAKAKERAIVGEVIARYLTARQGDLRRAYYIEKVRYLERYWKPLHHLPIDCVARKDVVSALDDIAEDHGKVAADRARTALSGFFAWAIDRSYLDASPVHHIRCRASGVTRHRVLSEEELVSIWQACHEDDYGRIVQLLILTGQRRTEISDLSWHEIDFDRGQIDLPGQRTKNKLPHVVPLSLQALAIVKAIPSRLDRQFVFGDGERGFQGWSRAKRTLGTRLHEPLPLWTLHDIRRSVNTHLNELGLAAPHVVEAIMNHVSGHKAGVAGVYNKSAYSMEKRQALEKWGTYLSNLLTDGK